MRHETWRRLIVAPLVAVLLAAVPGSLSAASPPPAKGDTAPESGWFDHYRRAGVHSELEDWSAVESSIQKAIAINPRSQRNVRIYGMWHASYMPYFFLGLAEYRQGRYQAAMGSFRKEEKAGVIQHDPVAWLKMQRLISSAHAGPKPPPGASTSPSATGAASAPASPGPDGVIAGLEAFFKSDYEGSIAAFQEAMKVGRDDDLTLHLYLGMAYAGKASSEPDGGKIWENLAFLEFQRVHALDPGYRLSSGIFSEEMMALFEGAGGRK